MTSPSTKDAQRLGAQYSLLIMWLCCMIASRRDGSERSNTSQSHNRHHPILRSRTGRP